MRHSWHSNRFWSLYETLLVLKPVLESLWDTPGTQTASGVSMRHSWYSNRFWSLYETLLVLKPVLESLWDTPGTQTGSGVSVRHSWQKSCERREWPLTTQPTGHPSHRLREECPYSARDATDRGFWLEDSVRRKNCDSSGMFLYRRKWNLFSQISKTSTDFLHFCRTLHCQ